MSTKSTANFSDKGSIKDNEVITNKCLLIVKKSEDKYLVEVGYPLSLYEAFAACLANNDSKLLVN